MWNFQTIVLLSFLITIHEKYFIRLAKMHVTSVLGLQRYNERVGPARAEVLP
jgi:hypothetical protein